MPLQRHTIAWTITIIACGLWGLTACETANTPGQLCVPGATQACTCDNGDPGAASCALDDSGWEACACDEVPENVIPLPPPECLVPENLPNDPLARTAYKQPTGQSHLLDVAYDEDTGLIYSTGIPGLIVGELQGSTLINRGQLGGKYEHMELLGDGMVALTSRGKSGKNTNTMKNQGFYLFDASNPSNIVLTRKITIDDAAGMALNGHWMYVLSHDGMLRTIDVSVPESAAIEHELTGLGNPWKMVVVDDLGYVADNTLGVVVLDLSQPDAPALLGNVSAIGGAQDVVFANDHLFVAVGTAGVEVFSLDDPTQPTSLGATKLGGAVISVSVADNLLWTTNQERVQVVDASDPTALTSLAFEDTPSWAMHVHAIGTRAFVADWKTLSVYDMDPSVPVAQADPSKSELYFSGDTTEMSLTIANRGSVDLTLEGLTVNDPRLTVEADVSTIGPGEETTVYVTYDNDGTELNAQLCMATNDPNAPTQQVTLATTSEGSSVLIGEAAPNFVLPDTDGMYHELADHKGKVIVLIFFATW